MEEDAEESARETERARAPVSREILLELLQRQGIYIHTYVYVYESIIHIRIIHVHVYVYVYIHVHMVSEEEAEESARHAERARAPVSREILLELLQRQGASAVSLGCDDDGDDDKELLLRQSARGCVAVYAVRFAVLDSELWVQGVGFMGFKVEG